MIPPAASSAAIELVSQHFDVRAASILSTDRHQEVAEARHVAIWLLKTMLEVTWQELAELFGQRTHTTALRSYRSMITCRKGNGSFRAQTDTLAVRFGNKIETMPAATVPLDRRRRKRPL